MSTSTQIYISLQRIRGEGTSNLAIATAFPADYHASIYFFRSCFFYFRFLFIYMYTHTHIHTYIYIYPFFFFSSFFPSSLFFFYFFFRHSVPVLFLKRIISGIGHRVMKFSLNIFSNWFRSLFFSFLLPHHSVPVSLQSFFSLNLFLSSSSFNFFIYELDSRIGSKFFYRIIPLIDFPLPLLPLPLLRCDPIFNIRRPVPDSYCPNGAKKRTSWTQSKFPSWFHPSTPVSIQFKQRCRSGATQRFDSTGSAFSGCDSASSASASSPHFYIFFFLRFLIGMRWTKNK